MNQDNSSLSARDRILARVRANRPKPVEHPDLPVFPIAGNPLKNFISNGITSNEHNMSPFPNLPFLIPLPLPAFSMPLRQSLH